MVSLEQPTGQDGEATLRELLPAPSAGEELEDLLVLPELIERLPDLERSVIRLRYLQDLKQSEIGERVGCSQMQVSRLLRRALERMRAQLVDA